MSREILQSKTCKELRELAKERNISGRWDMTKDQLIEAILGAEEFSEQNDEASNDVSAKDEVKIDDRDDVRAESKIENDSACIEINMEQKMPYIEQAPIGSLVAFRLSNGKVKSAKIVKKSAKGRKLKLETDYGAEYIASFDDVLWVRTGKRWPRGIYELLKGKVTNNAEKEQKA